MAEPQRASNESTLKTIQIPLPPLEVQKEIVAEIEGYQKVINGARAVLDNYRPHIPIHPDWPMVEFGEVCATKITDDAHFAPGYFEKGSLFEAGYAVTERAMLSRRFLPRTAYD